MLVEKIKNRESGIVLYGIVPPKKATSSEQIEEISSRQIQRLQSLKIDGLILYDIQDEKSRTSEARPFHFTETLDSFAYSQEHLCKVPPCIARLTYTALQPLVGLPTLLHCLLYQVVAYIFMLPFCTWDSETSDLIDCRVLAVLR
jgi:hypothetical protein